MLFILSILHKFYLLKSKHDCFSQVRFFKANISNSTPKSRDRAIKVTSTNSPDTFLAPHFISQVPDRTSCFTGLGWLPSSTTKTCHPGLYLLPSWQQCWYASYIDSSISVANINYGIYCSHFSHL